ETETISYALSVQKRLPLSLVAFVPSGILLRTWTHTANRRQGYRSSRTAEHTATGDGGTASSSRTGKNTPPPTGMKLGEGIEFQNNIIGIITQPDEGQPAA
uniref:Uncharacterized protein n=1 Tax=Anopheles quadriannulatus TaxID=34691 RepID=A0A182XS46_ANOQN